MSHSPDLRVLRHIEMVERMKENEIHYKEEYDKLKRFVKDLYPYMSDYCKGKVDGYLPNLKESEDEKIRKDIIIFLRSKNGYMNPDEYWNFHNRWLPWLEKQRKKHSCRNCQTFQDMHQNCPYSPIYTYSDLSEAHKHLDDETNCKFWIEKRDEQKKYADNVVPKLIK